MPVSFQLVALAPDDLQVAGVGRVDLQLLAQMADVYRHGVVDPDRGLVPHGAVELRGRIDLAGVLHEIVENVVFLRRERDRLAVERDALGVVVQLDPADRDDRRRLDRRAQLQEAAQLRFDPRQHLHGVEGLCDVVVRAHAQPQDLV